VMLWMLWSTSDALDALSTSDALDAFEHE